jgi:hypothetical protein
MSFLQEWIYGVDLDAEQKRSDDLDAALARENKADLDNGTFTQAIYDEAEANRARGSINVEREVNDAFKEGFNDGVDNIRDAAGSALALPFRLIPPIAWVIIAIGLFFYLGGGVAVRKKVTH